MNEPLAPYIHVRNRCQQRFRIVLSHADYTALCRLCGKAPGRRLVPLWLEANRQGMAVRFRGQRLPVVFDRVTRLVVTVLPREVLIGRVDDRGRPMKAA